MQKIKMERKHVVVGQRFYMPGNYGNIPYYFGFEHGKNLVVRRKNGHYIGEVTEVTDEGFKVTLWIMRKEASVFVRYDEIVHVKPKNDFD